MQHNLWATTPGVCSSEQRSFRMTRTVPLMESQQPNGALAATWIMGAGLVGLLGNVTSVGGAAIVLGLGLVPPMLLILRRNRPAHAVRIRETIP